MKARRNKTIDTDLETGRAYLERCISLSERVTDIDSVLGRTVLGDSLEVMPLLPEGVFDLIIADPPYNMRKSFNGSVFPKKSAEEYADYTRIWLTEAVRLLRDGGTLYLCCDWETSIAVAPVLGELLNVRSRITWEREKGRGSANNWKNSSEDIWYCTKGENFCFNVDAVRLRRRVLAPYRENGEPKDWRETGEGRFRDTCPSNFWDDITVPFWSMPENTAHPTQKPEKLIAKLILASTKAGDTVFDPFYGSGTTGVAAKKLGRRWLGIEREREYCVWAEERLERADSDARIQGYDGEVFYERNAKI